MAEGYCLFLIDSGATISTFRQNKLKPNQKLANSVCTIRGVGAGSINTLGHVITNIVLEEYDLNHTFQIVPNDFPVPGDGILGLDFLKRYNCQINYDHDCDYLYVRPGFTQETLAIKILGTPIPNHVSLPARAEVIRKINLQTTDNEVLIPNQEIFPGVFIARTIVCSEHPFVRIINTTFDNIAIKAEIKTESLSEYNIYDLNTHVPSNGEVVLQKLSKNFPKFVGEKLEKLCKEYTDIFALETDKISANNFYKQKFKLTDDTPVYIKNYRIPHTHKQEIVKQVDKLLQDGIIEPSNSAYNSPLLLVPKKPLPNSSEKRWRMVIDYRQLNKKLVADKFPLPRVDEILDQLGRAKYFSCLDLMSGFHQIPLELPSRDFTSFSTDNGSFRFTRLPFGVKVAPNSFQRMMTMAFAGLSPTQAFLYMDDLMVIAASENQMIKNLRDVFNTCRKFNLKLHPDKCSFFKHETTFLGHKCTAHGILPDDQKYDVIKNYPRPVDADGARRFVAFANYYRRFIKNFAEYSRHITNLTKKKVKFDWNDDCEKSFNYLKNSLIQPQILKYPDFNKSFCITTDASKYACGAILSQEHDNIQLPISYASRGFTKGEQNKSVIEQELAAIHWSLNYFRPYIYGTKFLVKSDHRPLTYLFSMKNPSSKLTRMRLDLEEFDFEVEFIKGTQNVGADALSRIDFKDIQSINTIFATTRAQAQKNITPSNNTNVKTVQNNQNTIKPKCYETINLTEVKNETRLKFILKYNISKCIFTNGRRSVATIYLKDYFANGILDLDRFVLRLEQEAGKINVAKIQLSLNDDIFKRVPIKEFKRVANLKLKSMTIALTPKILVISNNQEREKIIKTYHDNPITGGHTGKKRLIEKIRQNYYWKRMSHDIATYIKNCPECQKNKTFPKNTENLTLTPTPQSAFDIVLIDTVGPFIKSNNGYEYAVTIICDLTKYLVTVPTTDKTANSVARAIFENFILVYGPMKRIVTDKGTEYENQLLKELCTIMKIEHETSTAYHHQTLGTVERVHRTFNEYVRSYISTNKMDWDQWLSYFTYCFNTTPSTVHGYCPYELIFGKNPEKFEFLSSNAIDPIYNVDAYDKEIKYRLQTANRRAQSILTKLKITRKQNYDAESKPANITINDLVLLKKEPRHKLDPLYTGPYKVKSLCKPNCTIINNKGNEYTVHMDRLRVFRSVFFYRFLE